MKNILVTGGAGFIGSNFILYILGLDTGVNVINLDALTYAGNLENLSEIDSSPYYTFIKGDICDKNLLNDIFKTHNIDTVVNFAAESHVDRSITNPEVFLKTNVYGTHALLECAKLHWVLDPSNKNSFEYVEGVRFLQVSTDEVYGTLGDTGLFTENSPLSPNSPYSASKASADMFVRAYHETFGLPTLVTRCSNNYGPRQFPEKLIPLMINNCLNNKQLPVYGQGLQVRDWLHVQDHCIAIHAVLEKAVPGEVYNIGGNNEKENIDIVRLLLFALNKPESLIQYVQDRPGHDQRYAIDNAKITKALNWLPSRTFEQGLQETINWYLSNKTWLKNVLTGDYKK